MKIQQVPREEYEQHKKLSNEVRESLFLESSSKIKDICYIEGERDIKTCNISFPPIKTKLKNRRLISLATDYSIHTLGMKEIFIKTASNDRNMIENLEAKGFESLGEGGNVMISRSSTVYYELPLELAGPNAKKKKDAKKVGQLTMQVDWLKKKI